MSGQNRFGRSGGRSYARRSSIQQPFSDRLVVSKQHIEICVLFFLPFQDKPNRPELSSTICDKGKAHLNWRSTGDNNAPLQHYIVESVVYIHDYGRSYVSTIHASAQNYTVVPVRPWSNYVFRVIAKNKIGRSNPSFEHFCSTDPDVPYSNPENVGAAGTEPNNLVIIWTVRSDVLILKKK